MIFVDTSRRIRETSFDGLEQLVSRLKNTVRMPNPEAAGLKGSRKLISERSILAGIGEECVKVSSHPKLQPIHMTDVLPAPNVDASTAGGDRAG